MNFDFAESVTRYCLCSVFKPGAAVAQCELCDNAVWEWLGRWWARWSLHQIPTCLFLEGCSRPYENFCLRDPGCFFSFSQIKPVGRYFCRKLHYWQTLAIVLHANLTKRKNSQELEQLLLMFRTKALSLRCTSCLSRIAWTEQRGLDV